MIVFEYGSVLWIGSPYGSPSTDFTYNSELQILSVSICNGIYYMTNLYRPGIKKFDWFKAGL